MCGLIACCHGGRDAASVEHRSQQAILAAMPLNAVLVLCGALHLAMAAVTQLRSNIEASKKKLEAAKKKGESFHKALSSANCRQLEDLLRRSKPDLQPQDYVELVDLLGECPFREEDMGVLCGHLETPRAKKACQRKGEKLSQDYTNFHIYMNDEIQDAFLAGVKKYDAQTLQALLFNFVGELGLERGDESTYKRMNSFLLAHTEKKEKVDTMTAKTLWLLKNALRDSYLKQSKTAISKCMELPQCTAKFLTEHPQLYEAVLGKSMPPKCRLNMTRVLEIEAQYSCRNEGSSGPVGRSQRQQPQLQPYTHDQNSIFQGVGTLLREFLPLMGMLPNVQQNGLLTIAGGARRGSRLADEIVAAAPRSRPSTQIVRRASTVRAEEDKEHVAKKNIKEELAVDEVTDQVAENNAEQVAGEENAEQLAGEENSAEQVANKKNPPGVAALIGAIKDRQREKADERKAAKAKAKVMAIPQPAAGASEAQPSAKSQAQRATAAELETKRTKEKNRTLRMIQETIADKE